MYIFNICYVYFTHFDNCLAIQVSNPQGWPTGCVQPRMAMNAAQQKVGSLLKTFFVLITLC